MAMMKLIVMVISNMNISDIEGMIVIVGKDEDDTGQYEAWGN